MPRAAKRSGKSRPAELASYDEKRDFSRTPEPPPAEPTGRTGPLTFLIQKHDASRLHYDFRLEVDGVLKSWSVPKGPSLDNNEKRLAVMVEDHPFDYGTFEGVIPKGEYGAGQVIVWDNGTYSPDEDDQLSFNDRDEAEQRMREELAANKISITLRGAKVKGSWTLVKLSNSETEWLLIKHRDFAADEERDILDEDASVISGLTIDDIRAGRLPDRTAATVIRAPEDAPRAKQAKFPSKFAPMNAHSADKAFSDPRWLFEPKLDGIRIVALIRDGEVTLLSRNGLDNTAQYPYLVEELAAQPVTDAVIDGEVVAIDEDGRPSFGLLQQRLNLQGKTDIRQAEIDVPVLFYAFDLPYLEDYDLTKCTLTARKELLKRVLLPTDRVLLLDAFDEEGEAAYEASRRLGLEGIVAKRKDSVYEPGKRSHDWLKIKAVLTDDFVVGGFSQGQGGRSDTFGALLLGRYDDDGNLVYAGHAGSGFTDQLLAEIRKKLDKLTRKTNPFSSDPPDKNGTTWVKPELVAEVKFAEWTSDGNLRAPVFLRLREDKPPEEVRVTAIERVAPEPATGVADDDRLDHEIDEVLDQLESEKDKFILKVGPHKISVSNLDKELWTPDAEHRALTKRDYLIYLAEMAPYLLPHLRDRPLTLVRYPNGIAGSHFYQKHIAVEPPAFVELVPLYSSHNEGDQEYVLVNNLPTLLWLGQLADIELHTWYMRTSPEPDGHHLETTFTGSRKQIESSLLNYPDFIVIDLDPYIYSGKESPGDEPELNKKAFAKTCEVAGWIKDVLDSLSLSSFVKTTGKTGLHIYVPILRQLTSDEARAACEVIGQHVLQAHPKDITMEWSVDKRTGKIFFDHNQNVRGKTLASIYSPRALPGAPVSMPVAWDELDSIYPSDFTILTAPDRIDDVGDLWENILDAKHDIAGLLSAAE